jgi:hypothetical protein
MKMVPYFNLYAKIHSEWVKDLIRLDITFLEENEREKLLNIDMDNDFLARTSKAQIEEVNIVNYDYIKVKVFCTAKQTIEWPGGVTQAYNFYLGSRNQGDCGLRPIQAKVCETPPQEMA